MAAGVRASVASSTGPTLASASGGIVMNRDATPLGATSIPRPDATGTAYSWRKVMLLEVMSASSTSLLNRKIRLLSATAAGITVFFKDAGDSYVQPSLATKPTDSGSTDDAVPSGYTLLTTTPQLWDADPVVASSLGKNGHYVDLVAGVSHLYVSGAGNDIGLPNIEFSYDEG